MEVIAFIVVLIATIYVFIKVKNTFIKSIKMEKKSGTLILMTGNNVV